MTHINSIISKEHICKKQSGTTLIEFLLYLAIAAAIVGGAIMLYSTVKSSNQSSQMIKDVVSVQAGVSSLYIGQSNYDGLTNEVLYNAKKLPSSLKYDNGTLITAEGGTLEVEGDGLTYTMTITDVSSASCVSMVSSLSTGFIGVSVDGTELASSVSDFPISTADAASACGADQNVTIIYTGSSGS